jgi:hypothetical protein
MGQLFFMEESGYLVFSLPSLPGLRPWRRVGRSLARMERL